MIPALKELIDLAECDSEDNITLDEYYKILFQLKIRQACVSVDLDYNA